MGTTGANLNWRRLSTKRSGPIDRDSGLFYVELDYNGGKALGENWRAGWAPGDACPITYWQHLTLVEMPTITEAGAGIATATLRFEGIDINLPEGQQDKIREEVAEFEVVLTPDSIEKAGNYTYVAPVVRVEYTQDSKRSAPKAVPNSADFDDPVPQTMTEALGKEKPSTPAELIAAQAAAGVNAKLWKVITLSEFVSRSNEGAGWVHMEYHTKKISAILN